MKTQKEVTELEKIQIHENLKVQYDVLSRMYEINLTKYKETLTELNNEILKSDDLKDQIRLLKLRIVDLESTLQEALHGKT